MKIVKVICSAGKTGFFFDDQKAIKAGAKNDGAFYEGAPSTEGFTAVRQAGESISVLFVLEETELLLTEIVPLSSTQAQAAEIRCFCR